MVHPEEVLCGCDGIGNGCGRAGGACLREDEELEPVLEMLVELMFLVGGFGRDVDDDDAAAEVVI